MDKEDAEEYTQALSQVVAGSWRQIALAFKLEVPETLGLERREWVEDRLGGYMRMTIPDRKEAVAELADEGMPIREIGDVLGIGHSTAARDLAGVPNGTEDHSEPIETQEDIVPNGTEEALIEVAPEEQTLSEEEQDRLDRIRRNSQSFAEHVQYLYRVLPGADISNWFDNNVTFIPLDITKETILEACSNLQKVAREWKDEE